MLEEADLDPTLNVEYNFQRLLTTIGWVRILDLPKVYYPGLARQFYANLKNKGVLNTSMVRSFVNGQEIILTRAELATLLGPLDDRPVFDHGRYTVTCVRTWVFEVMVPRFCHGAFSLQSVPDPVTSNVHYELDVLHTLILDIWHACLSL